MSKRKSTPQNIFVYWWREFLFANYFELESDQSPQVLAEDFRKLSFEDKESSWQQKQAVAVDMHVNQKGFDFKIVRRRKYASDFAFLTTARARGKTFVDGSSGKTRIQGTVTFGRAFHLSLVGYLLYLGVYVPRLIAEIMSAPQIGIGVIVSPIVWTLVGFLLFFYWRRIYNDRNMLAQHIETALNQGDLSAREQRLQDENDSSESDLSDTRQIRQRRNQHEQT